jgi:probable poly-beta-1,6-N-acetyl-D-glucosamine export protein
MQNANGWLQGIQYFRAIAIIEVIVLHVTGAGLTIPDPQWIIIALSAFTYFGVMHFIFISGVVLYNKYNNGFSLSAFYKRRFSSVLPPYVVWSTFYFAVLYVIPIIYTYLFHQPTVYGSNQTIASLLSTYVIQLALAYQQLWFVLLIIQLYLLYPLLVKMYNRTTRQNSPIFILSFLLLIQICYVGCVFLFTKGTNPDFGAAPENIIISLRAFLGQLVITYSRFLFYAFYFVFGFFIAQRYEAMKQKMATLSLRSISLAVLVSTIYYAVIFYHAAVLSSGGVELPSAAPPYGWLFWLTGPFYCLILIFFYLKLSTGWAEPHGFFLRYLERIGEDSFGIFLVHYFFLVEFSAALFKLGLSANNLLFYPVLFLLILISSYLSVEAIYRLPFSNIIIGSRRKKQASVTQTSLTN